MSQWLRRSVEPCWNMEESATCKISPEHNLAETSQYESVFPVLCHNDKTTPLYRHCLELR